jgi:acetyl-CoA carboxylase beta subunit
LAEECPKECVPCPKCKHIKYRSEIEEHLEVSCDKVMVACPECNLKDLRSVFRSGKHECLSDKPNKYGKNRDQGVRNFEEVQSQSKLQDSGRTTASTNLQNSDIFLTGPVTQA